MLADSNAAEVQGIQSQPNPAGLFHARSSRANRHKLAELQFAQASSRPACRSYGGEEISDDGGWIGIPSAATALRSARRRIRVHQPFMPPSVSQERE